MERCTQLARSPARHGYNVSEASCYPRRLILRVDGQRGSEKQKVESVHLFPAQLFPLGVQLAPFLPNLGMVTKVAHVSSDLQSQHLSVSRFQRPVITSRYGISFAWPYGNMSDLDVAGAQLFLLGHMFLVAHACIQLAFHIIVVLDIRLQLLHLRTDGLLGKHSTTHHNESILSSEQLYCPYASGHELFMAG